MGVSLASLVGMCLTLLYAAFAAEYSLFATTKSVLLVAAWCGGPNLAAAALAVQFRRYFATSLVVLSGAIFLGPLSTLALLEHVRPTPPGMMNCGPPAIIVWPVLHWSGVVITAAVAGLLVLVSHLFTARRKDANTHLTAQCTP